LMSTASPAGAGNATAHARQVVSSRLVGRDNMPCGVHQNAHPTNLS
jgi:hypothetical protein